MNNPGENLGKHAKTDENGNVVYSEPPEGYEAKHAKAPDPWGEDYLNSVPEFNKLSESLDDEPPTDEAIVSEMSKSLDDEKPKSEEATNGSTYEEMSKSLDDEPPINKELAEELGKSL